MAQVVLFLGYFLIILGIISFAFFLFTYCSQSSVFHESLVCLPMTIVPLFLGVLLYAISQRILNVEKDKNEVSAMIKDNTIDQRTLVKTLDNG